MSKKRKQRQFAVENSQPQSKELTDIPFSLQLLAKKRIGGAVNLKGIQFQLLFAIHTILINLKDQTDSCQVWVEGVEDIDVYLRDNSQLFQIKTSQNSIDANAVWNMKALQHFLEAFRSSPSLTFCLVHNTKLAKGKLEGLGTNQIAESNLTFWHQKFIKEDIAISIEELKTFLGKVTFQDIDEHKLYQHINQQLFEKFKINAGAEPAFFQALFYWIFEASKNRRVLRHEDLNTLIKSVIDSFSKFPVNPAIQNNWVYPVSYQIPEEDLDTGYYDGKAAQPVDIARKLPIQRLELEKTIVDSIDKFDITVIKSSSGQGKSTLAWQVAYNLLKKGFSIYQLDFCTGYNEANAINDFIKTRLIVGQIPLIVIDGVNQNHSGWNELAKLLRDKPVKILITTRHEDWVRYGEEAAALIINTIEIKLIITEARQIYEEISKNKRLHPSITTWEPVWERIKDRGLMIEYIFLLTRGQMIAERLTQQVSVLKSEQGSPAKLEILRLISLADVLGIKIFTQRLSDYIQQQIGFGADRNEVYKQLEKEYYLRFENVYVEGLHPVRSEHLVSILHSHIPESDSLLSLLRIIDAHYVYDFFINAPLIYESVRNNSFVKQAAAIMAGRSIPEMVYAIDGLMHLEPYRYWQENKSIFDTVAKRGGIEIFIYDTAPFSKLQTIKNLSESILDDAGSNFRFLLEMQGQLTRHSINDSLLVQFSTFLGQELNTKGSISSFEGITFLFKWLQKLNINFPDIIEVNEAALLKILETMDIVESSDVFHFYSILRPDDYQSFIAKHFDIVIGWIKKKTNTLTIYEEGGDIHIHYLLDKDHEKANELSVYRINIVHALLPHYKHYCTKAIILPFPNAEIYNAVLQNSTKRMSPDTLALGNNFDVHSNQIWVKTILDQYSANSTYEWQKQYLKLREHCLELYKKCLRLIEVVLEQNSRRVNTLTKEVASSAAVFFELEFALKKYPSYSKKYFEINAHSDQLAAISQWLSSFHNFVNQLGGLMFPKTDRDLQLPLINIRAADYRLCDMQKGYDALADKTHKYFVTGQLCLLENNWLRRLFHTVQFYINCAKLGFPSKIVVASRAVEDWKATDQKEKLAHLHSIISNFKEGTNYRFYLPTRVIEDESLDNVVIGIQGFDMTDENQLWSFSMGLSELSKTDIHFFIFVMVNSEQEAIGAFRIDHQYFAKFQQLDDKVDGGDNNWGHLLPMIPDETMLLTLEGVTLKKAVSVAANESFFQMMFNIWKLIEHRNRLNPQIPPENIWLEETEKEYGLAIQQDVINAIPANVDSPIDRGFVDKILENEINPDAQEICNIMMQKALRIQFINQTV